MKNEQIVAVAADAATKWMLIQSIIGTHGLSKELEGIAILLLVRGHAEQEVLWAVEEIRNDAGARDEALRHVRELELALDQAIHRLHREDAALRSSESYLLCLGQGSALLEAKEVVEEDFDDESEGMGIDLSRSPARRY